MREWSPARLGDVAECLDAIRKPVRAVDRRDGPYPYYGASGVIDHVDQYLLDGTFALVAEDGENLRTRNTPVSFLARGKFWVNNHAHILSGTERSDVRFLSYVIENSDISGYLTGSTQPKLTQQALLSMRFNWPPLSEQRAIAEVLGVLDDKIEANRRIESLCWLLAKAHFEAAIATADESVPLSTLLKLEYGKALPAGVRRPGATPVYGSGGIVGRHDKPLVTGPGIIVGRKGTAGSVQWSQRAFFPIDTTFYVTNVSVPMVFAYFVLRSLRLDSMNSDSAVPGLNRNTAMSQMVPLPGKEGLATFSGRAEVLVDAAEATASESCALETLRGALLPALVSGRLRVRDVEAVVEEAV